MLHLDPLRATVTDRRILDLGTLLLPGDLLILNDAATLPASLFGTATGQPVEVRLAGLIDEETFAAVLLGDGDWRVRTEDRPPPPRLAAGTRIAFAGIDATVVAVDPETPRLVTLRFDATGSPLWSALYRAGTPVQYSYLARPLHLWDVQSAFAGRPWAVEPPSAGFVLRWAELLTLRRADVGLARLTHAAGLSSTGDPDLDARLPLPERFDVPAATVHAIERARERGGRIVAVGTTVVRALESAARSGHLTAGEGIATLRVDATTTLRVADGILTGMHEPGTSHFDLLSAFAPDALLRQAYQCAEERTYLAHEFGDAMLVLAAHRQVEA